MIGAGDASDPDRAPREHTADILEAELVQLRRVIVSSMDRLAEQVLDQIQTTRSMADETESLLHELRHGPAIQETDESANHTRQVTARLLKAMRDIPESSWDAYVDMCVHLARLVRSVHESTD